MTGGGWTCATCGIYVGLNQSHTCRTLSGSAPLPITGTLPTYKPTARYHIHGRISNAARTGPQYDVDLVVEVIP
jgi:hypothetical protein